jgi:hypothetical protein
MLSRIRRLQPQLLTIVKPQPRDRNHNDTQKRQQTRCPLIPEFGIHLIREEREASSYEIADEDDACERRGRISLVAVDDVVEDGKDDDVDAQTEESGGDDGDDPVDAGEGSPSEPVRVSTSLFLL